MKKPYYNQVERRILKLDCLNADLMKLEITWLRFINSIWNDKRTKRHNKNNT